MKRFAPHILVAEPRSTIDDAKKVCPDVLGLNALLHRAHGTANIEFDPCKGRCSRLPRDVSRSNND